jgi:hypothetical protein
MTKSTSKPMIRIHNTETNEIIDREMTDEEFASYQNYQANVAQYDQIQTQKAADKAALLAQLGITEEQAKLLLG